MSTEDSELKELNGEIQALKDDISACKAKVPVDPVAQLNYLTSLNTRLAGLEARRERLEAQASSATTAQQGNRLFHFL